MDPDVSDDGGERRLFQRAATAPGTRKAAALAQFGDAHRKIDHKFEI